MTTENERSLQKRPELVPEKLMRGGIKADLLLTMFLRGGAPIVK